jgi:hypothetical protein
VKHSKHIYEAASRWPVHEHHFAFVGWDGQDYYYADVTMRSNDNINSCVVTRCHALCRNCIARSSHESHKIYTQKATLVSDPFQRSTKWVWSIQTSQNFSSKMAESSRRMSPQKQLVSRCWGKHQELWPARILGAALRTHAKQSGGNRLPSTTCHLRFRL